jgi:hypothetical protein
VNKRRGLNAVMSETQRNTAHILYEYTTRLRHEFLAKLGDDMVMMSRKDIITTMYDVKMDLMQEIMLGDLHISD